MTLDGCDADDDDDDDTSLGISSSSSRNSNASDIAVPAITLRGVSLGPLCCASSVEDDGVGVEAKGDNENAATKEEDDEQRSVAAANTTTAIAATAMAEDVIVVVARGNLMQEYLDSISIRSNSW